MKSIIILLIILSVSLNLIILIISASIPEIEKKYFNNKYITKASLYHSLIYHQYIDENKKITTTFIYDGENKKIVIDSIQEKKVLFIPRNACNVCIDLVLFEIKDQKILEQRNDVVLLFEALDSKDFYLITSKFNLPSIKIYYAKEFEGAGENQYPVFFVLGKANIMRNVFFIEKHNVSFMHDYLFATDI